MKDAENYAANASAEFFVDYRERYRRDLTLLKRRLSGLNLVNPASGRYLEYRDHRTIVLYGQKQTGKTTFILGEARNTDAVIVVNKDILNAFVLKGPVTFEALFRSEESKLKRANILTAKTLIEDDSFNFTDSETITRVFVDDALCLFDHYKPSRLYKAFLKQLPNLDHIVLVG